LVIALDARTTGRDCVMQFSTNQLSRRPGKKMPGRISQIAAGLKELLHGRYRTGYRQAQ
jgi:hypothetical protein